MGKIAIWILIAVAVMLLLRLIATAKRRVADDNAPTVKGGSNVSDSAEDERQRTPGALMMSCAVCAVHIPASDAVFARGKVFCGQEHRDADEASREAGG